MAQEGKVTGGGIVHIPKGPNETVFKSIVRINGRKVAGLFDTGASETTIGVDLAEKLGFDTASLYFDKSTNTAAGVKHAAIAEVTVDEFQVGSITVRNMGVGVNRFGGSQCLVGMNFFDSLDSFEIRDNVLTLRKAGDGNAHARPVGGQGEPQHAMNATEPRLPASCPYCEARMALPAGLAGKVRCHACDRLFLADTTAGTDGAAKTEPLA